MTMINPPQRHHCEHHCHPPTDDLGSTHEPVGTLWVCPHGAAWRAFNPSTATQYCLYQEWVELHGLAAWQARRKARR